MATRSLTQAGSLRGTGGEAARLVLRGAVMTLLALVAGALAVALVARLLGHGLLVVRGGSMGGALPDGTLVISRWTPAHELEPGDIIVVREPTAEETAGPPRIHRVLSIQEDDGRMLVRTKGDANDTADPNLYALPDRVVTPALSLPAVGYLVAAVANPIGWLLLVLVPGAWLCITALRAIWSDGAGRVAARKGSQGHVHGFS